MTKILVVLAGFIAVGAIVTGVALAVDRTPALADAPMATSGTLNASALSSGTSKITIQHVLKGCHILSDGSRRAVLMHLTVKPGDRIQFVDQDIDPQGLVQIAGPKLQIRGHMMMGQQQAITFKQAGVYRLKTRVIEMGTMMNVKTIGPDNVLRLTVSVR